MNFIGLLQEYYQKYNLSLPIYEDNGEENGMFHVIVTLHNGGVFPGTGKNKKAAKMEAARMAFESIESSKININYDVSTYLAVDVENIGNCFKDLERIRLSGSIKVGLYYSESWVSQLPKTGPALSVPFEIVKIPSSRKDASDIGMIMSLTQIAMKNEYSQIVIWTKDHYGSVVKEILESGFLGCKTNVNCITNL